ncbi:MAG: glycosyltransferase family 4 protein [Lachnospiraceae bacterium]|nr:glycosyltransferase family 4 protein [Lachnospiraceae bacterium]
MDKEKVNRRAVFITPHNIFDLYGNGGVKATQRNYELMKRCFGEKNVYVCILGTQKITENLKDVSFFKQPRSNIEVLIAALFGCKCYFPWEERYILKTVQEKSPDIVFFDSSLLGRLIRRKKTYKTVVFFHNVEADYSWNKVKNEGIWHIPGFWISKINEKCAAKKANRIICLNGRDRDKIIKLYNRRADFCLPITFDDRFDIEKVQNHFKKEILFFGSLFQPNQLGVEWFMENVLPKLPDIVLNIVGKGFEKKRNDYKKYKNVQVIGSVDEPDEFYYRHAVVVMPIQYGAGMKVKTAEAMMYGRIVLATDEALEGYEVENVEGIYRCNTADEYVMRIREIFTGEMIPAYQTAVRECFLKKYNTKRVEDKFIRMIENIEETKVKNDIS